MVFHFSFFISMDGVYAAKSQEGGAVISMDGVYAAKSQEGGAVISMSGGYAEHRLQRSQCIFYSAEKLL